MFRMKIILGFLMVIFLTYFPNYVKAAQHHDPRPSFENKLQSVISDVLHFKKSAGNLWDLLTCQSLREEPLVKYPFGNRSPTSNELKLAIKAMSILEDRKGGSVVVDLSDISSLEKKSGHVGNAAYKKNIGYYYLIQREIERIQYPKIPPLLNDAEVLRYITLQTGEPIKDGEQFQQKIRTLLTTSPELLQKNNRALTPDETQQAQSFLDKYMAPKGDFSRFKQILHADLPGEKYPDEYSVDADAYGRFHEYATFYNVDGYKLDVWSDLVLSNPKTKNSLEPPLKRTATVLIRSNALTSPRSNSATPDPIAYSIHVPADFQNGSLKEVKGIFVEVYGGSENSKRVLYAPIRNRDKDFLMEELLKDGYAYVTLNLPDLYDLKTSQHNMPEELFKRIQACIKRFWDVLSDHPEQIHPKLVDLKSKPTYLIGHSFGGKMAVRFAEKYPSTFTGYISLSGGLQHTQQSWLNPIQHIQKLRDPLLILHNYNDIRTPLVTSVTPFIEKAKDYGKDNLVSLYIAREGQPNTNDPSLHGHVLSGKYHTFFKIIRAIKRFIQKTQEPYLSMKRRKWDMRMAYAQRQNLYNPNADILLPINITSRVYDLFSKEALITYKNISPSLKSIVRGDSNTKDFDIVWRVHFQPLLDRAFLMDVFGSMEHKSIREFLVRIFDPLYPYSTDPSLRLHVGKNMAAFILPSFIKYLKKEYPKETSFQIITLEKLVEAPVIQKWFFDNMDTMGQILFGEFLMGNPQMVEHLYFSGSITKYAKDMTYFALLKFYPRNPDVLNHAKNLLQNEIKRHRSLIKDSTIK